MKGSILLNRAVNPGWVQDGFVTTQAFNPGKKDKGRLSVFNDELLNPQQTYKYFTDDLGFASAGIVSVTVAECELHGLKVEEEPNGSTPHEAHVAVDFGDLGSSRRKKVAGELRDSANERGFRFLA